jgi:hypothetical protein
MITVLINPSPSEPDYIWIILKKNLHHKFQCARFCFPTGRHEWGWPGSNQDPRVPSSALLPPASARVLREVPEKVKEKINQNGARSMFQSHSSTRRICDVHMDCSTQIQNLPPESGCIMYSMKMKK